MTDSPDLTPQQDAVRRLLAEARHEGPTPPEVVARLDETLAALRAERSEAADAPAVIDLAARRRRFVGAGVLAAAAVVVAGVALGQVLPQGGSDGDSATSAESSDMGGASTDSGSGSRGEDDGGDAAAGSPEELSGKITAPRQLPELTLDETLDETLTSLRADPARVATLSAEDLVACQVGEVGQGQQVLVQVDGRAGLVVFRTVRGPGQQADVYVCGDPEPVRTLTLPAP